jgi:antimicrobial peptide system SdpA family protein
MKNSFTLTFMLFGGVSAFLFVQTIVSNMPYNALRSGKFNAKIVSLLPEAYAFFTRSPREDQLYLYAIENNQLKEVSYQNTDPSCFYGISRKQRAKGIELGHLFGKVASTKKDEWIECNESLLTCENWGEVPSVLVLNPTYSNQICGEFLIVSRKIIPWAWSSSRDKINMPSKVIKINALCSKSTKSKRVSNP